MAMVRQREFAKTWSLLGDLRRKPSEYEVVTAKLHYHFRRQPAPFELDPNTPINTWYLRYREGSPFEADTWEDFRDPHQLTYQGYVKQQAERETYLENVVDEFERSNHDASLRTDWVRILDRLYLPARFPMHALQMCALYIGQMAPSSFITNVAYFQAADELRRIQWVAYRTKSLSLEHDPELASSTYTRRHWEEGPAWQPLREAVEKTLIAYDWGEAFVAVNLILKPVFDEIFNVHLTELARAHEDALLGFMLDDFELDSQRSRDWTAALVRYATAQRPANTQLLKQWVEQWKPLAYWSMEALLELFGQAPRPLEPRMLSTKVRTAHDAFLARCGLDALPERLPIHDRTVTAMAKPVMKKSGIDAIGDMVAWGAHFCLFYDTKEDLLDALISYCKSGLENDEYCLWVVTEPLTVEEATVALKEAVPNFDRYLAEPRIEILSANDFFLQGGKFDRKQVAEAMIAKLAGLSAKGYAGVRLTGDTSWVTKKDWIPFCELEEGINEVIGNQHLAVLCTYSLAACGAYEILDAVRTHQFAIARRQGSWVVIETAAFKQAKDEIKRLNEELEHRVVERTNELIRAEQRYRVTIETASDAVFYMDECGAILLANPAAMRVFGYEPAELIGKPMTVLMPRVLRKAHEDGVRRYLATGQRHINWQGTELTGLRKNGQEFPVEVSFGEMNVDGHRIFTGFVRDISERKQAEEQREKLRRVQADLAHVTRVSTMGELTGSLAHEIRQPLTAAVTNALACLRFLNRGQPDLPEAREAALEMVRDARRASDIIERVRSLFRKSSPHQEIVDVNGVIQEMVVMLHKEADLYSVDIHTELCESLPNVMADRVQLQQVLMNLMMNGIEAMRAAGGELRIESQLAGDGQLLISVMDSGVGLPTGKADEIFNPFFTTKSQGTGLGLAITRSIVESHGGRVWATANCGRGATFQFTLPQKTAAHA